MDRQDIETRRADNQVWNGAEDYGVRSDFHAFDPEGGADLYFNTVIGLVHHYYDFRRFKPLFNTFQSQLGGELYTDLFWLGLEGAVYRRAREDRPVLDALRREYAARTVARGAEPGCPGEPGQPPLCLVPAGPEAARAGGRLGAGGAGRPHLSPGAE